MQESHRPRCGDAIEPVSPPLSSGALRGRPPPPPSRLRQLLRGLRGPGLVVSGAALATGAVAQLGPTGVRAPAPPATQHSPVATVAEKRARALRSRARARARTARRRSLERRSRALGRPYAGRLAGGVTLPAGGAAFFTWNHVRARTPSPAWRRTGTVRLVRTVLRVVRAHRRAHPRAPRVGIGDLSRPRGGPFGPNYGGKGHVSHQNGLDVDVLYPRRDRRERPPQAAGEIDRRLAQDLVDRFVRAGATIVYVGPATDLEGPPAVVRARVHHDDHLHVRVSKRGPRG